MEYTRQGGKRGGKTSDNRRGGACVRSIGGPLLLDYFAMAQSTPSDLYFQPNPIPGTVGQRGAALEFRANETIPLRSFVTTGCDCRPIKVDSLQMDWKADGNHPPLACGWHLCRIYRGGGGWRNFPRLFRRILDGIHRDAVINYHSFVRRSPRTPGYAVII